MKIDYEQNPLGIVKAHDILYGQGFHLEGRIRGIIEDGFDQVGWYGTSVVYSKHKGEIPELIPGYKELRSKAYPTAEKAERALVDWCNKQGFKISEPECAVSEN